ncbi:hypothetical protein ACPYO6_09555 [Georgenia sp. Z1344]|uniref:hypothetical protein n=1 Tax=Georgenia sp. Z1344 TaxID=3416706 RepID=UPI003CF29159
MPQRETREPYPASRPHPGPQPHGPQPYDTPAVGRGHVVAGLGANRKEAGERITIYCVLLVAVAALAVWLVVGLVDSLTPERVGPLQVEMPWSPIPTAIISVVLVHVLGAIGVLVVGIVQQDRRRTSGDEAIQLLVTTAGLTGPGGLDIPWDEIRGVRVGPLPIAHGADAVEIGGIWLLSSLGRTRRQGQYLAGRAAGHSVRSRPPVLVLIDLVTPAGVIERAVTDRQRRAVHVAGLTSHVRVELTDQPADRLEFVVRVLAEELGRRGRGLYQL